MHRGIARWEPSRWSEWSFGMDLKSNRESFTVFVRTLNKKLTHRHCQVVFQIIQRYHCFYTRFHVEIRIAIAFGYETHVDIRRVRPEAGDCWAYQEQAPLWTVSLCKHRKVLRKINLIKDKLHNLWLTHLHIVVQISPDRHLAMISVAWLLKDLELCPHLLRQAVPFRVTTQITRWLAHLRLLCAS